jgi:hypothetical protein
MNKKYQVFVSSTYTDLKIERQACVEAILTAGHIPAGMELFSAGDETQLEIIKRWIDESDIYILLLGGRYGSIEPKSELSYTEIEYRYALEAKKPVFALVMDEQLLDEKVKKEGKQVLELTHTQKYQEFKKLVLSKISKFFKNTDQLQVAIMQSLLDIERRFSLTGWVKTTNVIDPTRILNQVSELNEKNKQLGEQLEALTSQTFIDPFNIVQKLSEEAKIILLKASKTKNGGFQKYGRNSSTLIYIDGINYPQQKDQRNLSIWEDAFEELTHFSLIKEVTVYESFSVYYLTTKGYEVADKIENDLLP